MGVWGAGGREEQTQRTERPKSKPPYGYFRKQLRKGLCPLAIKADNQSCNCSPHFSPVTADKTEIENDSYVDVNVSVPVVFDS